MITFQFGKCKTIRMIELVLAATHVYVRFKTKIETIVLRQIRKVVRH